MTFADTFNVCEAALWICMGLGFVVSAFRRQRTLAAGNSTSAFPQANAGFFGNPARRCACLGVSLIAFGVSDIVEVQTGAWWRPWWLFAWKATCLVLLVGLAGSYYRQLSKQGSRPD